MLRSFSRDWSSPMQTSSLSKIGSSELSEVGMSIPHWNIYCSRPTVFRQTDLPPALGPEISSILLSGFRFTLRAEILFPSFFRLFSSKG